MYPPAPGTKSCAPGTRYAGDAASTQAFNQYAQKMRQMAPTRTSSGWRIRLDRYSVLHCSGRSRAAVASRLRCMALAQLRSIIRINSTASRKTEADIAAAELQMPTAEQQYTINQAKVAEAEYLMRHPELQSGTAQGAGIWAVPVCGARISILHEPFAGAEG